MAPAAGLPDEGARERVRTQLDRNFLVEAGAGTGKTRLLVDRIEHLIASGTARLRRIVAITFTESAAAELRVAIRARIERRLRGPAVDAQAQLLKARFVQAREDLEIAPVSTIHAFAAELLRERPVEAKIDPAFDVADELTASLLRERAWDRWMDAQRDAAPEALRHAIEFGLSLKQLREAGDTLLRYRDIVTADLDPGPAPQDPIDWLRGAGPKIQECVAAIDRDCMRKDDNAVEDLRELARTLDTMAHLTPAEVRRRVLGHLKCKVGGNQGNWRPGRLRTIKDALGGLDDDLAALRASHAHWLAAGAVNWLRGYGDAYRRVKAQLGVLDFDDLLLLARDLLRDNRHVRLDFQERFDAILVDEFQDTDPLQAEIIFFLAEDGAEAPTWDRVRLRDGKLFIVGDPKQSIYAFRRADIETYERVKTVLAQSGTMEHITANFRSVKEILGAVNAVFKDAMRKPADGAYQPDYVALEPSTETRPAGASPLVLFYPGAAPGGADDVASLRKTEAEALAAYLRHAVDTGLWTVGAGGDRRPARFGDVALLFRGMSDVPVYEEALARYELPYRVTSSRTFYVREEVGWLVNVLTAIEHPTDAVAVWGAMRSPMFGCSDREIHEFVAAGGSFDYRRQPPAAEADAVTPAESSGSSVPPVPVGGQLQLWTGMLPAAASRIEAVDAAMEVLRDLHRVRNDWSVPRLVEEVLARTRARITFLLTPQGEQRVSNLNKIVTLARALEESGLLSLRAFVRWLRDMEQQAVDEAEPPTVEPGDDIVRVMSIHAAKGLEFPIVVVPDLGRPAGGGARHLLVDRLAGTFAANLGKVGDYFQIQTNDHEALKEHQAQRDAAERLRLLYVAMTRARDALVLPVFPKAPKGTMMSDLGPLLSGAPRSGESYKGWSVVDGSSVPRRHAGTPVDRLRLPDTTASGAADGHPRSAGSIFPERRSRDTWFHERRRAVADAAAPDAVVNPSSLTDQTAQVELARKGARLESDRGGRSVGEVVHAVLAVIPADRPDLIDGFVRYFGRRRRLSEALMARAAGVVRRAMGSEALRAALAGAHWHEVPFAVATADGVIEGAADLLTIADGEVTIVDFKTDAAASEMRAQLDALYGPQLQTYADVVKRATGARAAVSLLYAAPASG